MFLLMEIGCLECVKDSRVIGVFSSKEKAEKHARTLDEWSDFYRPSFAQYNLRIFEIPEGEFVAGDK